MRAAGDGDRIRGDAFEAGSGGTDVIVEGEGKSFFNADAAGTKIAIGKRSGDELCGAFVFLPDADFDGVTHRFAHAAFFKGGRNQNRLAGTGNDESEKTLAESPADTGEIVERTAGAEKKGIEFWIELRHELLGVQQACVEFVGRNGMDAIAERLERRERGWKLRSLFASGGSESYHGQGRGGLQEATAGERGELWVHGVRGWDAGEWCVKKEGKKQRRNEGTKERRNEAEKHSSRAEMALTKGERGRG